MHLSHTDDGMDGGDVVHEANFIPHMEAWTDDVTNVSIKDGITDLSMFQ